MNLNEMFAFEESPWELYAESLKPGGKVSAVRFLTLLEGQSEDAVEDAFLTLETRGITLELADLPKPVLSGEAGRRMAQEEALVRQGMDMTQLSENDPLRLYLEELAGIPVCGDWESLAPELARVNDAGESDGSVAEWMLNLCLSRVVELAGDYTGRGVLLTDLIQEGSMGLWKGILSYRQGQEFARIRDEWIRRYMVKAVVLQARENGVGQRMQELLERFRQTDRELLTRLGRNPTLEEIAARMEIHPEMAMTVQQTAAAVQTVEKVRQTAEPQEDPEENQAVEDTAYFQSRQRIAELLSALTEEDAKILSLRFGLEGGLPLDPEQTGGKLGLTAQEVVSREASALARLRNHG